jgi:hypothetical protein
MTAFEGWFLYLYSIGLYAFYGFYVSGNVSLSFTERL